MPDVFTCAACLKVRDFHSQAIVMACLPEDAEFVVAGVPCVSTGFCLTCMEAENNE